VRRFLGEGGKKRVYLAHDTKLDRDVAFALIKTDGLDDEGLLRIKREAQAMGRLGGHPHIVSVFDIGEEPSAGSGQGGQPYLVSQLMGGGDVEGLIEKASAHRVELEAALRIADQVCQALEHAHSHGIVHRDLKPGNVWLTADPSAGSGQALAKLGDFGLAVALDRSRLTQAGMMVGTVHYMPPEQALGGEVTPRSDHTHKKEGQTDESARVRKHQLSSRSPCANKRALTHHPSFCFHGCNDL
jgi:serine/threonine protein kinase